MSARYTQSKSEAQKHTEILKGMLKKPENKVSSLQHYSALFSSG